MKATIQYADGELIAAINDKKELDGAILFLYQQYADTTRSFIMSKGGSEQDADDIFQETVVSFIEVVQKGKFRQEATIRTFLISISKNLWFNEIRKRQRSGNREKLFETGRDQEDADIQAMIGDREVKQQFQHLLAGLGESCRKILILFYYENLPMKEIVTHLHYENEQVVRNKKGKCLQQLTALLKMNPVVAKQISELNK
jgi:RNA polymerase sigma factor (sigma-70 family)